MIFNLAFNNELKTFWNEDFVEGLRFFILVVLPLLLVAGIIEGILIGILGQGNLNKEIKKMNIGRSVGKGKVEID